MNRHYCFALGIIFAVAPLIAEAQVPQSFGESDSLIVAPPGVRDRSQ